MKINEDKYRTQIIWYVSQEQKEACLTGFQERKEKPKCRNEGGHSNSESQVPRKNEMLPSRASTAYFTYLRNYYLFPCHEQNVFNKVRIRERPFSIVGNN